MNMYHLQRIDLIIKDTEPIEYRGLWNYGIVYTPKLIDLIFKETDVIFQVPDLSHGGQTTFSSVEGNITHSFIITRV